MSFVSAAPWDVVIGFSVIGCINLISRVVVFPVVIMPFCTHQCVVVFVSVIFNRTHNTILTCYKMQQFLYVTFACGWRISKAIQDILHFDLMQQEDKSWPQGSDRQLVITAYEYQSPLWRGWSLTTSSMPPGCWKVHCVFELVIFRILDKSASLCDPLPVCVQLFTHL